MKTQQFNGRALTLAMASILAVGAGAYSVNSYAVPNTAILNVGATIAATCEVSTTAVAFGTYDPIGAYPTGKPLDISNGKVTMTCTTGSLPIVALDLGANFVGAVRNMKAGTAPDLLHYELYQPSGFTTVWGTVGTARVTGALGDGSSHDLIINARITGGQNVATGIYADVVNVAVTF